MGLVKGMIILFQHVGVMGRQLQSNRTVLFSLSIRILQEHGWNWSVMIGDGKTDLETNKVVTAFVGYSGIKDRKQIQEAAYLSVSSFEELIRIETMLHFSLTIPFKVFCCYLWIRVPPSCF